MDFLSNNNSLTKTYINGVRHFSHIGLHKSANDSGSESEYELTQVTDTALMDFEQRIIPSSVVPTDNLPNKPGRLEDMPDLVRSRATKNEDSSTVPDSVSDFSENARIKAEADKNHWVHDTTGTPLITLEGKSIPDEDLEDTAVKEKYIKLIGNFNSPDECQEFYDHKNSEITEAYRAARNSSSYERDRALAHANGDTDKINEINDQYNKIDEENLVYFTRNAASLTEIGHFSAYPIHMHADNESDGFPEAESPGSNDGKSESDKSANRSLIDDYADPNLEQPSYMDPED